MFPGNAYYSFNSILVRLKAHKQVSALFLELFQFHTGSIKRLYESHGYIIQNPYDTGQVDFYIYRFRDRFAVDLQ